MNEPRPTHPFKVRASSEPMMRADGRRLVRALTLSVLSFLLLGGATGFALAQGGDQAAPLLVPAPRPGDRVTYDVERIWLDTSISLGGAESVRLDRVQYEWLPEEPVLDANFADRLARPLQTVYSYLVGTPDEVSYERTVFYDAADGRVLFQRFGETTDLLNGPYVGSTNGALPDGDLVGSWSQRSYLMDGYRYTRPPCGTGMLPLHGTPFAGGRIVLQGRCGWADAKDMAFTAEGWSDFASGRSYRFISEEDRRIQLRFGEASPFPVSFTTSTAEYTDPDWAVGRLYRFTMASAKAGSGAYTTPGEAHLQPAPGPIAQAPLTPWGLDDAGMAAFTPLTLADAYAAALAQPNANVRLAGDQESAADWTRRHTGEFLAFAMALEYHDDTGARTPQWILLWVDGADWLGKRVSWETAGKGVVLPVDGAPRRAVVTDWEPSWLPEDVEAFFPDARDLPSTLPRPSDMVDEYRRMFGADAPLNRYGFQVFCLDSACDEPQVLVEVGLHEEYQDALGLGGNTIEDRLALVDKLMVGADGRASYRVRYTESTPAVVPLAPDAAPASRPQDTTAAAAPWVLPASPKAATGISLVAALAGALYYFWPALKGATVGLFSRTRDDELLAHPRRAQVLQLVEAQPGIHFQDLARTLGIGRGNLEHHLRKMVAAGVLTKVLHGGYACYFPKGAVDRRVMAAAPLLRSGGRPVLAMVRERPGLSGRQIALELGLSQSTVSYHLRRLEKAGLVFGVGAAGGVRLSPLGEQASA